MTSHPAFRGPFACAIVMAGLLAGAAVGQEPSAPGWTGSNAILVASRHLIHAALARPTQRTTPIEETFERTRISGMSFTQGNLGVELLPSDDKAHLNLVVLGVITTKTIGRNGPITLHNQGTIPFEARKPVFIDAIGISYLPTKTCARARDELLCIDTGMKHDHLDTLVKQFARQQYFDTKPRAEKRQTEKAEEGVNQASDQDIEAELATTNNTLQNRLNQIRESGLVIQDIKYRTTPLALRAAMTIEDSLSPDQRTTPPETPWPVDLSLRLHQGVANQFFQKRFAGKTYKREDLMKEIRGYMGSSDQAKPKLEEEPKEEEKKPQQTWVSLKFDAKEPIVVDFANKGIKIRLKTETFDAGVDEYEGIVITVRYRIEPTASGPKLIRDGEIMVTGSGGFNQAAAAIIKRRLTGDLPEEMPLRPMTPPEGLKRVGTLKTTHMNADLGWLSVGWER
jgi:hypothetical protein